MSIRLFESPSINHCLECALNHLQNRKVLVQDYNFISQFFFFWIASFLQALELLYIQPSSNLAFGKCCFIQNQFSLAIARCCFGFLFFLPFFGKSLYFGVCFLKAILARGFSFSIFPFQWALREIIFLLFQICLKPQRCRGKYLNRVSLFLFLALFLCETFVGSLGIKHGNGRNMVGKASHYLFMGMGKMLQGFH